MVQAKVASSWLTQILMDDSGGSTAFTSGFTQIKKKRKVCTHVIWMETVL